MSVYLISEMAKKTGLSTDTLRFYEKKGFIQPNFRASNQYRYYGEDAFIKKTAFYQALSGLGHVVKRD